MWNSAELDPQLRDAFVGSEVINGIEKLYPIDNCTNSSAYHVENFCTGCATLFDLEGNECLASFEVWSKLARSIAIGLLSISSSMALLPELVRGQWRVAFGLYILCQILFRVLSFTMALTVASFRGNVSLFYVFFAFLYMIQATISQPKRVEIVKESLKQKNLKQMQKERQLERKQQKTLLVAEYDVLIEQPLQARKELDSQFVRTRSKKNPDEWVVKKVRPGDVITTMESDWLPCGKQRVQLRAGWLSVFDEKGLKMIQVRKRQQNVDAAGAIVATPQEKLWIGLLTIIVPVQFDTIKNIHKSNPQQETKLSFYLRVWFNVMMTAPFIYFLVIDYEKPLVPYTYQNIDASPLTGDIKSKVWKERISESRALLLLQVGNCHRPSQYPHPPLLDNRSSNGRTASIAVVVSVYASVPRVADVGFVAFRRSPTCSGSSPSSFTT